MPWPLGHGYPTILIPNTKVLISNIKKAEYLPFVNADICFCPKTFDVEHKAIVNITKKFDLYILIFDF